MTGCRSNVMLTFAARWGRSVATLLFVTAFSTCVGAHEVRPAYLEIDQTAIRAYKVVWKQPTMGELAVHLVPHISNGWLEGRPFERTAAGGFLIRSWLINTTTTHPLAGSTISIEGLESTITDVLIRIRLLNGQALDTIARPEMPGVRVTLTDGNSLGFAAFVTLGIEHILSGPDHLAFIFGLLLIVADLRSLLKTVSAFTVAHSLTLAAVALGSINLPSSLIDALIALSIVFLAPEALRAGNGGTSLTIRCPWIVAFAFGLLHGLGFASGLSTLGLEKAALASALVSFNVGIELGQVGFILPALGLLHLLRPIQTPWPRFFAIAPSYAIGTLGALWAIENGGVFLGGFV